MNNEYPAAAAAAPPAPPPEDWHTAVTHRRPTPVAPAHDATAWRVRALAAERRAEAAEQQVVGLETALTSRPAIDQAEGVIMAVYGLAADEAFQVLVRVSQHANLKLAHIAEQIPHRHPQRRTRPPSRRGAHPDADPPRGSRARSQGPCPEVGTDHGLATTRSPRGPGGILVLSRTRSASGPGSAA